MYSPRMVDDGPFSRLYQPLVNGADWPSPGVDDAVPKDSRPTVFEGQVSLDDMLSPAALIGRLLQGLALLLHVHDWESVRVLDQALYDEWGHKYPLAGCYAHCKSCGLDWFGRADRKG